MEQVQEFSRGSKKILSADDQLALLRAGVREVYEIQLRNLKIPMRVLSNEEAAAVRREALQYMYTVKGDETDKNLHIQKTTLKLASTITKGGAPFLSDKLLDMLSLDELQFIYSEYVKMLDDVNPSLDKIHPDKFRALVEALKKNAITSRDLSLPQLKAICSAFQDMIQRQDTPKSQKAK